MPIKVLTIFDEGVCPPGFYRHLERLPKRKRAEFVRQTAWSGFACERNNGLPSSDGQEPPDKSHGAGPQIDHAFEEEIRAIWLTEED